jgi:hypothetical protein
VISINVDEIKLPFNLIEMQELAPAISFELRNLVLVWLYIPIKLCFYTLEVCTFMLCSLSPKINTGHILWLEVF